MNTHYKSLVATFATLLLLAVAGPSLVAQETDTDEAVDVNEVLQEVQELIVGGEFKEGLELTETALQQNPKNSRLIMLAANGYTAYGIELAGEDRKAANKPLPSCRTDAAAASVERKPVGSGNCTPG